MKKGVFLFIILFWAVTNAFAATYYVATNGSDADPGTQESPWATIQHAAEVLVTGDTVFIRGGVYNEQVQPVNSGNLNAGYIVYSAYPGEQPIIDGTGVVTGNNGFNLHQKSYIKLLNLRIRNWNHNGIWVTSSDHLEISDCEVYDCGYGIGMTLGTHDFELNRVKMHHFTWYGFDASPSDGSSCYNGVFNDCIAYTGRDLGQNVDGFALGHGDQHDFTFNRCITYDVFDGFDISSRNTTLNRCLAYNCWNGGYKLWQDNINLVNCLGYHNSVTNAELDWSGTSKTVTFQNCTFMDAGTFNISIENANDWLNMYNCIVAGGDNIGLGFEQMDVNGYSGDYNIFHNDDPGRTITVGYTDEFSLSQVSAAAWTTYSGEDEHSFVSTDPNTQLFRNLSAWDLHLREGSIAIDQGTAQSAPSEDYDGNPRPAGPAYDIGGYEYSIIPINVLGISTNLTGPPAAGDNVTITLTVRDQLPSSDGFYKWWLASGYQTPNYGNWQSLQNWTQNASSFTTTLPNTDDHYVIVAHIAEQANSATFHQAGLTLETQGNNPNPIQITALTTDMNYPQPSGTPINLSTTATGGSSQLSYRYWYRYENGSWMPITEWSNNNTAPWTPTQDGVYTIIVWVSDDTTVTEPPLAGMLVTIEQ